MEDSRNLKTASLRLRGEFDPAAATGAMTPVKDLRFGHKKRAISRKASTIRHTCPAGRMITVAFLQMRIFNGIAQ